MRRFLERTDGLETLQNSISFPNKAKQRKMTFYLKDANTDKFRRVSRKAAMEYVDKT